MGKGKIESMVRELGLRGLLRGVQGYTIPRQPATAATDQDQGQDKDKDKDQDQDKDKDKDQ